VQAVSAASFHRCRIWYWASGWRLRSSREMGCCGHGVWERFVIDQTPSAFSLDPDVPLVVRSESAGCHPPSGLNRNRIADDACSGWPGSLQATRGGVPQPPKTQSKQKRQRANPQKQPKRIHKNPPTPRPSTTTQHTNTPNKHPTKHHTNKNEKPKTTPRLQKEPSRTPKPTRSEPPTSPKKTPKEQTNAKPPENETNPRKNEDKT